MSATTIHALFDLDGDLIPKLNLAKRDDPKVASLLELEVLMLDEVRDSYFFYEAVLDEAFPALLAVSCPATPCRCP